MPTVSAMTALPYAHLERATPGLRGALRQKLLDKVPGELPDWSTLQVADPVVMRDARGRTWWEYAATVKCR